MEIEKKNDVCALCGQPIRKGTVFIVKHVTYTDGPDAWIPVHLWCNARLRGATAEKLRTLPTLAPPGRVIGEAVALPTVEGVKH